MTHRPTALKYIDSPEQALDGERDLLARVVSGECDTALSFLVDATIYRGTQTAVEK